jgi:hypothetical protein
MEITIAFEEGVAEVRSRPVCIQTYTISSMACQGAALPVEGHLPETVCSSRSA